MEAADRVRLRDGRDRPGLRRVCIDGCDELEWQSVRVAESKHGLAESRRRVFGRRVARLEALAPEVERIRPYRKGDRGDLAITDLTSRNTRPRKECEDRARRSGRVTEIEMIGAGVIEVDRELHEPQPEHQRVEVERPLGIARNRSDVMNAGNRAHRAAAFQRVWRKRRESATPATVRNR